MGYGLWAMGHRPWAMVYGLWAMRYGPWAMVYGLWAMDHGLWINLPLHLRSLSVVTENHAKSVRNQKITKNQV